MRINDVLYIHVFVGRVQDFIDFYFSPRSSKLWIFLIDHCCGVGVASLVLMQRSHKFPG